MARHYTVHSEDLVLRELKRKLEKKSGIHLHSFSDCRRFSEVLDNHGIHIAAMTLSRCFGITKSEHRPFLSTLDLLSSYLDFQSFNHFRKETDDVIKFALDHPDIQFQTGEYGYSALELALQVNDWETALSLIESFDAQHSSQLDFIWFLGEQVRKKEDKDEFLDLLAHTKNGKKYFYESFVDEDDTSHYFSTALQKYYKPQAKSIGDNLFVQAYLDSKRIYKGLEMGKKLPEIYLESYAIMHELHYQQISRLFEMRILNEFRGLNRFSEMEKIVDELLPLIANKYWRDQNWMLMRSVKALVFSGHFKLFMQHHKELKKQLIQQFRYCEGTMLSSADLALQFVIHASPEFKDIIQLPPTRLRHPIYNEQKARIAIESATATLYTNSALRKSLMKNLQTFAAGNEHCWVTKLLQV
jgi:calcineurin-like phosphoesterase family protein